MNRNIISTILLSIAFPLISGCETVAKFDALTSNETVEVEENRPSSVSLVRPTTSSGINIIPTIKVSGVVNGDTVKVFTDSSCTNEVGSTVSAGTSADITTSPLAAGSYTFYANMTGTSDTSACSLASVSYTVNACPTGYVPALGNADVGAPDDFCVMKYEAKAKRDADGVIDADGNGVDITLYSPVSVPENQAWRWINADEAFAECESLGANYHLISNPEWMALAREIEVQDANWTGQEVGTGCLYRGNSGELELGTGTNDGDSCGYNSATDPDSGAVRNIRAKHVLSNQEEVFDLSSNASEWTTWTIGSATFQLAPDTSACGGTQIPDINCPELADSDYNTANGLYDKTKGIGEIYKSLAVGREATVRGNNWNFEDSAGIYAIWFDSPRTGGGQFDGFRCVYRP